MVVALMVWGLPCTQAMAVQEKAAVINKSDDIINLSPYAYITQDAAGELSAQDVVQRFKNNIRGVRNQSDMIRLPMVTQPYWIAFGVRIKRIWKNGSLILAD